MKTSVANDHDFRPEYTRFLPGSGRRKDAMLPTIPNSVLINAVRIRPPFNGKTNFDCRFLYLGKICTGQNHAKKINYSWAIGYMVRSWLPEDDPEMGEPGYCKFGRLWIAGQNSPTSDADRIQIDDCEFEDYLTLEIASDKQTRNVVVELWKLDISNMFSIPDPFVKQRKRRRKR